MVMAAPPAVVVLVSPATQMNGHCVVVSQRSLSDDTNVKLGYVINQKASQHLFLSFQKRKARGCRVGTHHF